MSKGEIMIILAILGSLVFGLVVGTLVRGRNLNKIGKIITVLIWILLFCLGVKVGTDEAVVAKLPTIGLEALLITIGAVVGSIFFSWMLWHLLSKRNQN
ncbi:LysO family transporter [Bacteroides propionicifaciens]|jgi:uncharacterized membrane protein YbjE (DUF340 family)|uniref:LysO family transporter n=1 Tax=Bacteroides propionicifaciens TaxID=392838 RepID=UPI000369E358|nr:LysO family transporter [Bacteroides propionicifaciens]